MHVIPHTKYRTEQHNKDRGYFTLQQISTGTFRLKVEDGNVTMVHVTCNVCTCYIYMY